MRRIAGYAMTFCAFAFLSLSTVGVVSAQPATSDRELTQAAAPPVVTAPAQPQVLVVPSTDDDGWDFTPLVRKFSDFSAGVLMLAIAGILGLLLKPINKFLGTNFEAADLLRDLNARKNTTEAVEEAFNWVKRSSGISDEDLKDVEIRNTYLNLAARFVFKQYPEVWKWIDQGEKGVMQYLESKLPAEASMPKKVVEGVGVITTAEPAAKPAG